MTSFQLFLLIGTAGIGGLVFGYILRWLVSLGKKGSIELKIQETLLEAKEKAQKIVEEADKDAEKVVKDSKLKIDDREQQLKKLEDRVLEKDKALDKRQADIDNEVDGLKTKIEEIKEIKENTEKIRDEHISKLEEISALSKEDAKEELVENIKRDSEENLLTRMQKLENNTEEKLEAKAKDILANIIQRLATSTVAETMATSVTLPNDGLKGKMNSKGPESERHQLRQDFPAG